MRLRTLLLVLAVAAVGLFALLNWSEIARPTQLNLGLGYVSAPLGVILIAVLAIVVLIAIAAGASTHSRQLAENRQHAKALQAQRDLAERAEASRFTDLRTQLDNHLRELRQRDTTTASEIEQGLSKLRNQLDQLHRSMGMRLGEMEARMDARLQAHFGAEGAHDAQPTAMPTERGGPDQRPDTPANAPTNASTSASTNPPMNAPANSTPRVPPEAAHPAAARYQAGRDEQALRNDEAGRQRTEADRERERTRMQAEAAQRARAAHGPDDNDRRDHDRVAGERPKAEPVADEPPRRRSLFDRLR